MERDIMTQHERIWHLWRMYRDDIITQSAFFAYLKDEKRKFKIFKQDEEMLRNR
jgi:hypothetical protein